MRASTLAALCTLAVMGGCKGSNGGSSGSAGGGSGASLNSAPQNSGGSGSAEVTYRPNVRMVEQSDGTRALISVSTDGSVLVFDRSRGTIPALGVGDVLLIKGLLARKILATEIKGNEVAVLTAPVALGEIIADGKISVHAPIRFGKARSASAAPAPHSVWEKLADGVAPPLYAQSPTEVGGQEAQKTEIQDAYGNLAKAPFKVVVNGWEAQFVATPADGRLNLTLQMKKSLSGVVAVIDGDGYLADFDFSSDIDVQRSTVEKMEATYKKLNGAMNFKWAIQTTADGKLLGNSKIKLPAAVEIPLYQYLGGLPLYLEISSAVLLQPALNGEFEFSRGAFRVTYDGYQTFSVKGGNADADGNVTGDINFGDVENGSGAPLGLVIAFAAPRIELSIGVSKVVPMDAAKEAAETADSYVDLLVSKAFGADGLAKFKSSPFSEITATKIVETAMGSDAAAYIELTTSSGTSHTGSMAMTPCTRTDIHMWVKVGASAHAMGESVGDASKEIFRKDYTRIFPSEDALCRNI